MTHLSDVFKYISHFRHAGHQVGRKVGDMLEVLTYAALEHDPDLRVRLHIEPKLFGFCDAGHKVEFALTGTPLPALRKAGEIRDPGTLIGFVECKKVGVEQTVHTAFKKNYFGADYTFHHDEELVVKVGTRENEGATFKIKFQFSHGELVARVTSTTNAQVLFEEPALTGHRLIFALTDDGPVALSNGQSLREVPLSLLACRILEFQRVGVDSVKVLLNACLPGPQTPEKAKQASFVALDC